MVDADILGVSPKEADSFLIRYQAANPNYQLTRTEDGSLQATWRHELAALSEQARALQVGEPVDPLPIIDAIARKLESKAVPYPDNSTLYIFGIEVSDVQPSSADPSYRCSFRVALRIRQSEKRSKL